MTKNDLECPRMTYNGIWEEHVSPKILKTTNQPTDGPTKWSVESRSTQSKSNVRFLFCPWLMLPFPDPLFFVSADAVSPFSVPSVDALYRPPHSTLGEFYVGLTLDTSQLRRLQPHHRVKTIS